MTVHVFDGFKGLWFDFWGFTDPDMQELLALDSTNAHEHFGDFWDQPAIMMDDVGNEFLLDGHTGKDSTHSECHGFKCVDLVAEGFTSRLFLHADMANIIERSAGAVAEDDFVQAL